MKALKLLLGLAIGATVVMTYLAPDAQAFMNPSLARIIFYHLPFAFLTPLFLIAGAFYSVRFLTTKRWDYEVKAVTANELGFMFSAFTMATGVLFSKVQWGEWWQWDPRQTSFLMVLFIFASYFALRAAYNEENRRAAISAAYAAAAALPTIFLIFVFPRLPQIESSSFHPSSSIAKGGFDQTYWITILTMFALMLATSLWMYRMSVRSRMLEHALETQDERLVNRGRAAATGMVRPVSVPPKG
jgi:heme exporter protein C